MGGLANVCKVYGRMDITDEKGNKVTWVYDYANGKPRLLSEMTKEELIARERAKYGIIKEQIK